MTMIKLLNNRKTPPATFLFIDIIACYIVTLEMECIDCGPVSNLLLTTDESVVFNCKILYIF